jgi:hypothetical protein
MLIPFDGFLVTLAQVFGALLGLYIIAMFYIADKFSDTEIKFIKIETELFKRPDDKEKED